MTAPSTATDPHATAAPLRVALLGLGTVGREVARGLLAGDTRLADGSGGRGLRLVAVADRDPARFEGLPLDGVDRTDDGARLIGRPDVDAVVELIGGVEGAGRLVAAALDAGHAVVTANKALLSRRGAELECRARERGVALRFEAAVGGAIPVLATLAADLAANRIDAVRGIVNGSTNYVLTSLAQEGGSYDGAIARAKELGYLEADPSADVEGRDAADKLAILARLAFGAWPDVTAIRRALPAFETDGGGRAAAAGRAGGSGTRPPGDSRGAAGTHPMGGSPGSAGTRPTGGSPGSAGTRPPGDSRGSAGTRPPSDGLPGITGVTAAQIEAAGRLGFTVKLVARTARAGDAVTAWVLPVAVPSESALARTDWAENRIEIDGDPVGRVALVGQGAGGGPTSSAILGDLLAVARGEGSTWAGLPAAGSLAADRLTDGMAEPRRWLVTTPGGEARLAGPVALDGLRVHLAGTGAGASVLPVLDEG